MWQCGTVVGRIWQMCGFGLCHPLSLLSQPPVLMVSILPSALAPIQVLSYLIQVMGRVDDMFAGMYSPTLGAQGYTNRLSRLWEQIPICQILPGRLDSKRLEETYTCRCFLPFGQFGSTKTRSGSGAMVGWNYWQHAWAKRGDSSLFWFGKKCGKKSGDIESRGHTWLWTCRRHRSTQRWWQLLRRMQRMRFEKRWLVSGV